MEAAFDAYFCAADLDRDGRISGQEAVAFFKGSGLPQPVLAQVNLRSPLLRAAPRDLLLDDLRHSSHLAAPIAGVAAVGRCTARDSEL
jgi:hypothetical protein